MKSLPGYCAALHPRSVLIECVQLCVPSPSSYCLVRTIALKGQLAALGIRIGANGTSYTPLDMTARKIEAVARVSFSYLNVDNDIERLAQALEQLTQATPG